MNRQEFLTEVGRIVGSDRQAVHGAPEDNFKPIAEMWTTYLKKRYNTDLTIDSKDVAWMMVLLKVVRAAGNPNNIDNLLDVAGYVACVSPMLSTVVESTVPDVRKVPSELNTLLENRLKEMDQRDTGIARKAVETLIMKFSEGDRY